MYQVFFSLLNPNNDDDASLFNKDTIIIVTDSPVIFTINGPHKYSKIYKKEKNPANCISFSFDGKSL